MEQCRVAYPLIHRALALLKRPCYNVIQDECCIFWRLYRLPKDAKPTMLAKPAACGGLCFVYNGFGRWYSTHTTTLFWRLRAASHGPAFG